MGLHHTAHQSRVRGGCQLSYHAQDEGQGFCERTGSQAHSLDGTDKEAIGINEKEQEEGKRSDERTEGIKLRDGAGETAQQESVFAAYARAPRSVSSTPIGQRTTT